jgi:hypothetical protein
MRIAGSGNLFPTNVARAYGLPGVRPATAAAPSLAPDAASPLGRVAPAGQSRAADALKGAQALIAGHVAGPITFDGVSVPNPTQGVYHLYTRAADKIEAATAVQIGRNLDIKG